MLEPLHLETRIPYIRSVERGFCPIAAVCTAVEVLGIYPGRKLTLWPDAIGHVTTRFDIFDFL